MLNQIENVQEHRSEWSMLEIYFYFSQLFSMAEKEEMF